MNYDFVSYIENKTNEFLNNATKQQRKKIGQFFTPAKISAFMANLSMVSKPVINVLDAGAGSGILAASLIRKISTDNNVKSINIDLYENNSEILPLLRSNMIYIVGELEKVDIKLTFSILNDNFIIENKLSWTGLYPNDKYDIVISNPPYKKIAKKDAESQMMPEVVYGQPNLYFLFMAMGSRLLKENGEFIFIVPRSFTSGLYFTKFRKWFLNEMELSHLHLFLSRKNVFKQDKILQETVILKAIKRKRVAKHIVISESNGISNIEHSDTFSVPYDVCVDVGVNSFIYLPTSNDDTEILELMKQWNGTLVENGYKMKTGTVVDFRAKEWLLKEEEETTIPLLWAYNFNYTQVKFPINVDGKPQYLISCEKTRGLIMPNQNYLLLKRFTSKEEIKRLQCVMYKKKDFIKYANISTENHINYITKEEGELSEVELYGLYILFNSTIFDKYFRLLNGSTQVNANEINSMPFPNKDDVVEMGKIAMEKEVLNTKVCDLILSNKYNQPLLKNIAM